MIASARMRVCMIVANNFTHDARVTREAKALADAGAEVVVLAVRGNPTLPARERIDGFTVERLTIAGGLFGALRRLIGGARAPGAGGGGSARAVSLWRVYAIKAGRTLSAIRFNRLAARRAAALQPDVYHCHDFDVLLAGFLAARRAPAPVVYDSHELYAHLNVDHPLPGRRAFIEAIERRLARRAAGIIVVSDSFADHFVRRYGVARPTVVLNVPEKLPMPEGIEVPEPLRRDGVKVLYVGGIQRARGIEEAIGAIAMLPGAHLIVMGPGFPADEARLRALATELNLNERVHFLPPVPHAAVTTIARHATLALVPFQNTCLSHYLTIPNKIFESLHAGLPVVASDFPELRRIVETHGVGRVCDASDPAALALAIDDVVSDPAEYEQMRKNAAEAARAYAWPNEAAKLLGLYEKITGFPRGAA